MNPFDFWSIDTDRRANKGPELYNVNNRNQKYTAQNDLICVANTHLFISFSETFLENSSPKFNSKGEKYISVW